MSPSNLISILLPVRNASPFLHDCVASIINQREQNWELIAIDDHSDDDSFSILQAFAKKDSRIQVFQNKGKGIIHALRYAYHFSKGNLITRMDADDMMEENKLSLLKNILLKNGKGNIAVGLVKYFSSHELGEGYKKYEQWLNQLTLAENNFDDIYKECVIPSPCWMVYKNDLDDCGGFDFNIYPEDYDLCFRFYKNKLKVQGIPEVLHLWRDHSSRSSRNDPNYANQQYFDLKLPYFLELEWKENKKLILWGAGRKGKILAKKLKAKSINFIWISDNQKKIGKDIYDIPHKHFEVIKEIKNPLIIIAVASPSDQKEINTFLNQQALKFAQHYFYFC